MAVLADELLVRKILTPFQVARFLVHCYPYFPDARAVIGAVAAQHEQQKQQQMVASAPAQKPAEKSSQRQRKRQA